MKVISDASPLIGLSSIGRLNLLKSLWNNILIPEAIYNEVVIRGKERTGSSEVKAACQEWIKVVKVQNRQEIDALQTLLDLGEAEVITLGQGQMLIFY